MLEGVLAGVLNRVLAAYVDGLNTKQLNVGIWSGDVTLRNLRLKPSALDHLHLPIDVREGYLGQLTLSIPWSNLKGKPVRVLVENVSLLAVPRDASVEVDPVEEDKREQALKQERLQQAELLANGVVPGADDTQQESFISSLVTRIVDNVQVTVRNIHVRYEDALSSPAHPFAVGFILAELSAVSTDENWKPTFVQNSAQGIHKLARLDALSVYWNTDCEFISASSADELQARLNALIPTPEQHPDHQYILEPVSGAGRLIIRRKPSPGEPIMDGTLVFDQIGLALDDEQYRDGLSIANLFQFYTRQARYRSLRPPAAELEANRPLALFRFAGRAILSEVHRKRQVWMWDYIRERRDRRRAYVSLFKKKLMLGDTFAPDDADALASLEQVLSYQDILFFRSIARTQLRRERTAQQAPAQPAQTGWFGWMWGSSQPAADSGAPTLNEEERKELYEAIDWNEDTGAALEAQLANLPPEAVKMRIKTHLQRGSLRLRDYDHGHDILSAVFDHMHAEFSQRVDGLEAAFSLGALRIEDGTTKDTVYPEIVHVKDKEVRAELADGGDAAPPAPSGDAAIEAAVDALDDASEDVIESPFFTFSFEHHPLDGRADNAIALTMRSLEIVYHRSYIESIVRFFRPPESELVVIDALIDVASSTLEGLTKETRAGLEHALESHKTLDVVLDVQAPIIVLPEQLTTRATQHVVLDAGHISMRSLLADPASLDAVRAKQNQPLTPEYYVELEKLMYDRYFLQLDAMQLVLGDDYDSCMTSLAQDAAVANHLLERINLSFTLHSSILPRAPNLTSFKMHAELPSLRVHFSDAKYWTLMKLIDAAIPQFDTAPEEHVPTLDLAQEHRNWIAGQLKRENTVVVDDSDDEDAFFDTSGTQTAERKSFEFELVVGTVQGTISRTVPDERLLAEAVFENFKVAVGVYTHRLVVDVSLGALDLIDRVVEQPARLQHLITSRAFDGDEPASSTLVAVRYMSVSPESPDYVEQYDGIDQHINVDMSTLNLLLTRESVLTVYDWIISTFATGPPAEQRAAAGAAAAGGQTLTPATSRAHEATKSAPPQPPAASEKMRIKVKLSEIALRLNNDGALLATLLLSTGDMALLMRGSTMRLAARIGSLSLKDDMQRTRADASSAQLVSIEGDELIDLAYETFDAAESSYPGYDSLLWLRCGAIRFCAVPEPIHEIALFFGRFAEMKEVYDAATQAAATQATTMQNAQNSKMRVDVLVKSPVVVCPLDVTRRDHLCASLGELYVCNTFDTVDGDVQSTYNAGLRNIYIRSNIDDGDSLSELSMLDDVQLGVRVTQRFSGATQHITATAALSDIALSLTRRQYLLVLGVLSSIGGGAEAPPAAGTAPASEAQPALQPLPPPALPAPEAPAAPTVDVSFKIDHVRLSLYGEHAVSQDTLEAARLFDFVLRNAEATLHSDSASGLDVELGLEKLTMTDRRTDRESHYREIIPESTAPGRQVLLNYSVAAEADATPLLVVTVDSPKLIFALDPLFLLLNFLQTEAPQMCDDVATLRTAATPSSAALRTPAAAPSGPALAYRINIVDPKIMLLSRNDRADAEAIVLSVRQIVMAQQSVLTLSIKQLGVFIWRMNAPKDRLRLLNNVDVTLSSESRMEEMSQVTTYEINVDELIVRLTRSDVSLISSVVDNAVALSAQGAADKGAGTAGAGAGTAVATTAEPAATLPPGSATVAMSINSVSEEDATVASTAGRSTSDAKLLFTREELRVHGAGAQVILISEVHMLPFLDLRIQPFDIYARDWSADLHVDTAVNLHLNSFNLSTSHWEPLIEPWVLNMRYERNMDPYSTNIVVSSDKRLELNVSSRFLESLHTSFALYDSEHRLNDEVRSMTPFRLRNQTGYRLSVWSEKDSSRTAQRIEDGRDIPWRFEDWKAIREQGSTTESGTNELALHIDDMPWERVRHLAVDREGEFVITLRPRVQRISHKLLYEVKLVDNVKIVTFRSTFRLDNNAMIPIEVGIETEGQVEAVIRIQPGHKSAVPISAAYHAKLRVRPDPGFGYGWSEQALGWQDLMLTTTNTFVCPAHKDGEAPFRFQAFSQRDGQSSAARAYPRIALSLRAPVEIENLLPFDVQYRLFDKNLNHNWSSFLRKGGASPVHVVETSHLLLLSVELDYGVYSPSEFAIIASDNPDDFPVEKTLQLADSGNHKLELHLHYYVYPDSGGAFKVQIYSPYILLNQTELPLALRARTWGGGSRVVAGQEEGANPLASGKSTPFLLSHGKESHPRFLLRAGDSMWSKPLSFDVIGSEFEATVLAANGDREAHLGLQVEDGLGRFKFSKVVKLTPRYILWNALSESLVLREDGGGDPVTIGPGEKKPVYWLHVNATRHAVLAFSGADQPWTAPFHMDSVGSVFLRISHAQGHQQLVNVEVMMNGSSIFIKVSPQDGPWPFQLRNESDFSVVFMQCNVDGVPGDGRKARAGDKPMTAKRYVLRPRSKIKYAWDFPAAPSKYIKLIVNERERIVNILEIGSLLPFKFPAGEEQGSGVLSLDVRADGATQTLVLSKYSESASNFKVRRGAVRPDSLAAPMIKESGFEKVDVDRTIVSSFNVELTGIGVSLVGPRVSEIAYVTFRGIEFHYSESQVTTAVNLICKWIQIDNQIYGHLFPIVLYPTIVPKSGTELDVHPTLQASIIRVKDESHGVTHIKYASLLLQELTMELDENFLFDVYDFVRQSTRATAPEYDPAEYIEHAEGIPTPQSTQGLSDDIYCEILHIQPLALNLSFMSTDRVNVDDTESSRTLFLFIFNALTMALGNINEAPVRLNALVIENVRMSVSVLQQRMAYHYGQEVIFQIHRILGSADFLGNPVGLFNNVSSGVADIFYEPYYGLVMHGNRELGLGIARGASNFVKKTVFGLSDSVSKLTGSISKGLAAATMDREFQNKWRMSRYRNKPRHALNGITTGANSLFTGVASGFEGLALRPLEGAEQGGTAGFVQGIGRGLVGAFTKPAVGFFDMASNVTEGLRNTTLAFEQNQIDRVRLPRFIASDGIIRPFSEREALGQMWLKNLDHGRLIAETYVAHVDTEGPGGGATIMLTENRILYVRTARLKVLWEVVWADLNTISLESGGIALVLRGGVMGPFLPLSEASTRMWLFRQISTAGMYYPPNTHAQFYAGGAGTNVPSQTRPQAGPSDTYTGNHLMPYLNQNAPTVETGDMGPGATSLDAFYIQQAPGSFNVPIDVPEVNAYGQVAAGSGIPSNTLPLSGGTPLQWGARQMGATGTSEQQEELLQQANAYPAQIAAAQNAQNRFQAQFYGRDDRHTMGMEADMSRGVRPVNKRRRTSPVPFNDPRDMRMRNAAQRMPARGMPGRREDMPEYAFPEIMSGTEVGPSGDLASWILGPEDQRANTFAMPDPAAYYRQAQVGPSGIRMDMPMQSAHMAPKAPLPDIRAGAHADEEPLYVNAKQYQRILSRRAARARMEEKRRHMLLMAVKQREEQKNGGMATNINEEWVTGLLALDEESKKPYLHESRHKHAMRRPRGPGGRFLTAEEIRKRDEANAAKGNETQGDNASSGSTSAPDPSTGNGKDASGAAEDRKDSASEHSHSDAPALSSANSMAAPPALDSDSTTSGSSLPTELKLRVLAALIADSIASGNAIWQLLVLSRWYCQMLTPIAYENVQLTSAAALRTLRVTLALHRPDHGKHVRRLLISKCGDAPPLGVEQILLAIPNLEHLALDGDGVAKLCESDIRRTVCGAHPTKLSLALHTPTSLHARSLRTLMSLAMFARTDTLRRARTG
ncbi:Vacuolar protein sorting-associated protein 13 [Malassezia cuniculi]|uniref:Vacuolar protein sorting-associated protein 13 n=1 Tax=Malassezia cuniculi TaxID=948313 RepID=A0AAF0ERY2_9BASI|nr:Vacuolar protein sorting-associated protein 13 [Malassezia cuniculi]